MRFVRVRELRKSIAEPLEHYANEHMEDVFILRRLHDCFSKLEMLIVRQQPEIRAVRQSHHGSRNHPLTIFPFVRM